LKSCLFSFLLRPTTYKLIAVKRNMTAARALRHTFLFISGFRGKNLKYPSKAEDFVIIVTDNVIGSWLGRVVCAFGTQTESENVLKK